MDWYLKVLRNYFNFEGRARRKEYWMFALINLVISFGIGFVGGLLGLGKNPMLPNILAIVYTQVVNLAFGS